MRTGIIFILSILIAFNGWSQPSQIKKDLRNNWKISEGDHLEDYHGQAVNAIHLNIIDQFKGGIIAIKAPGEFSVFVNGRLQIRTRSELRLNVDSLLRENSGILLLSIFQNRNVKTIQTDLIVDVSLEHENFVRQSSHFTDFIILSALLLFGFFVILFRSNTRLTVDYLNLIKIFSFQEREEVIVTGRIGSSVNLLFFLFISLLCGLLLTTIFYWGQPLLHFSGSETIQSTTEAFLWWLFISFIIFVFLIGKLLLIWSMNTLFGFKNVVRFQFFNFIRSLYVASAIMAVVLIVYFLLDFKSPDFFYFLLASACGFMILSVFFLYFKLMPRTSSSVFHLFSYLCGSEIIPLMILVKLLLN